MKREWTPTQAELDAVVRSASARLWRTFALVFVVMMAAVVVVVGPLQSWGYAGSMVGIGVLFLVMLWFTIPRRIRRVMGACYPVGVPLSSEATEEGLVLQTALGSSVVAWSRFRRPRVGTVLVTAKDELTRQQLMVPRPLFPDAWLDRIGVPVDRG